MRWRRGFTLLELLVVIAIIGILSSVVLASLNSARAKSRDSKRMAEIKQVQVALEMYYTDHNSYPTNIDGNWHGTTPGCYNYPSTGIQALVAGGYLGSVPTDPNPTPPYYCYIYRTDGSGTNYKLLVYNTMETCAGDCPMQDPRRPTGAHISVYSPGGINY